MWWWWWSRSENNRNVVVVVERKRKCGARKTIEFWRLQRETIEMWWWWWEKIEMWRVVRGRKNKWGGGVLKQKNR